MDSVFHLIPLEESARRFVVALEREGFAVERAVWARNQSGTGFLFIEPSDMPGLKVASAKLFEIRHRLFGEIPNLVDLNTIVVEPGDWKLSVATSLHDVAPEKPRPIGRISEGWQSYEDAIVMKAA